MLIGNADTGAGIGYLAGVGARGCPQLVNASLSRIVPDPICSPDFQITEWKQESVISYFGPELGIDARIDRC
jgi:hypothetical protein